MNDCEAQYFSLSKHRLEHCFSESVNRFRVIDSRYDTTRVALVEIESNKTMVNFSKGLKNEIETFFSRSCAGKNTGTDSLILNVIRFKVSDNGSMGKNLFVLDLKFEFLVARDEQLFMLKQLMFEKQFEKPKKGMPDFEKCISQTLNEVFSEVSDLLKDGKKVLKPVSGISKPILKVAPITSLTKPVRGIYLSFSEFVNNEPNIEDKFDVVFNYETGLSSLKKKDNKFFYYGLDGEIVFITTPVWGYCDGKDVYKLENGRFLKLKNNNGVIEYWGFDKKNKPSYYIFDVQTGKSILY